MGFGRCGMGWGGWGASGIISLLAGAVLWVGLLAVLVAGLIWLARRLGHQRREGSTGETPLSAARRRLAEGEISVGEFDEIVGRLRAEAGHADR